MLALLTAGQAGDHPTLAPLVDALLEAGHDLDFRLLADKAYSHPSTRTFLRGKRIKHTIPERSDQIARRKGKGSRRGRPPGFDPELYALRNTVERSFNRFKLAWTGHPVRQVRRHLPRWCPPRHDRPDPPGKVLAATP